MESLSFLFVLGLGSVIEDDKLDIISKLPIEIAVMILRKLDGATLLKAQNVSKKWHNICQSDRVLRQKVNLHKRKMKLKKQAFLLGITGQNLSVPKNEYSAFGMKNTQQRLSENNVEIPDRSASSRTTMSQTSVRVLPLIRRSEVPFIVLESNGNSGMQSNGKRKRIGKSGADLQQKRRLRRL